MVRYISAIYEDIKDIYNILCYGGGLCVYIAPMLFEFEWNPSWIMNNESRQDICWLLTGPGQPDSPGRLGMASLHLFVLWSHPANTGQTSLHTTDALSFAGFGIQLSTCSAPHLLVTTYLLPYLLLPWSERPVWPVWTNCIRLRQSQYLQYLQARNKKEIFYSIFSIIFSKWTNGKEL